jgi:type III pantothenate kinase
MLLAIDVGNTNTVFGIHDGKEWVNQWRSATDPTKTADDHAAWLWRLADMHGADLSLINGCVISTVVPQAVFNFRNLARRYLNVEPMFIGDPSLKTGMEIRIRRPEQVGADRIVSALGAHKQVSRQSDRDRQRYGDHIRCGRGGWRVSKAASFRQVLTCP